MESSKSFLEKLLQKLKTGNSRSIHLNALPRHFARLDLFELINIDSSLHLKFLQHLLEQQQFKFKISIDFKQIEKRSAEELKAAKKIAKTLNALFYQQQDEFLEHGTKTFAFGYPLLIKRDANQPNKILKAPLLLWYLNIEKDTTTANTWTISRKAEQTVIFNEVLRSYIASNDNVDLDIASDFEEQLLSEQQILAICKQTLEQLGTVPSSFEEELVVLPGTNKASIEKLTKENPWIRWSGIFGLYRSQKQSIIRDLNRLIQSEIPTAAFSNAKSEKQLEDIAPILLDPSQENILHQINSAEQILIQGPPGTGKSQSLTAIITNALLQGKRCLLVCEKHTAMEVIQQHLSKLGLSELAIIIDDVYSDRKKVVDKVRYLLEHRKTDFEHFRAFEFEEDLYQYHQHKEALQCNFAKLNERNFGDDKLIDLIAILQKLKSKPHQTIDVEGDFSDFNYATYKSLPQLIEHAIIEFQDLEGKTYDFSILKTSFFQQDVSAIQNFTEEFEQIKKQVENTLALLTANLSEGNIFTNLSFANQFQLKAKALFSKNAKQLLQAQQQVLKTWKMISNHTIWKNFEMRSKPNPVISDLQDLINPLQDYQAKLQSIESSLPELKAYSTWQKFLRQQPKWSQAMLKSLSEKVELKAWQASAEVFYVHQFIEQQLASNDSAFDDLSNNFQQAETQLKTLLPNKIKHVWLAKQQALLNNRTISFVKNLYNYRRNKTYGKRNSLRKIVHEDVELFSTAFPVVMVNPSVCSSIFPLEKNLFDIVLFDEASQLRIEDNYAALLRGKTKIVSGDKHQMPPTSHFQNQVVLFHENEDDSHSEVQDEYLAASNSLLEYAIDTNFEASYLDFHYRSQNPDLIAFSNAAFYGNRLIPMPAAKQYAPISFHQIDGIYSKSRTNQTEAEAIVKYVYELATKATTPTIGIATFNINQRNLIWELLIDASYKSEAAASALSKLMAAGLFVKNLENIQGDERAIIIISTTFAPNEAGDFKQLFGPINQSKGYQLLNVIITRAKQQLAVFTSIPPTFYMNFMEDLQTKGNTGKAMFYAYLNYARNLQAQPSANAHLLEQLFEQSTERHYKHELRQLPYFHQRIYQILVEQLGQDNVAHNFSFGGLNIELAILENNQLKVALLTQHVSQQNASAYRLFLFKQQILKQFDIPFILVDAVEWFRDWEGSERSLIYQLKNFN